MARSLQPDQTRVNPPHSRLVRVLELLLGASATFLGWRVVGKYAGIGVVERHHVESAAYVFGLVVAAWSLLAVRSTNLTSRRKPAPFTPWLVAFFGFATLLTIAAYTPALRIGWLSDDFEFVSDALARRFFHTHPPHHALPAPLYVWERVFDVAGPHPFALHLLNMVLHAANGTLVVALARALGLDAAGAWFAGILFVTFPGFVEAVAWCTGIHDLLATFCTLAFVLMCGIFERRLWSYLAAFSVLAIGIATKETVVVAPVLGFVVWVWNRPAAPWKGVLAGATAGVVVWAIANLATMPESYATWPTRWTIKELITRVFGALSEPWSAALLSQFPVVGWLGGVAVVLVIAAGSRFATGQQALIVLRMTVWVLVSVAVIYTYFFVGPDLQGGRYIYLAASGWSILIATLASAIMDRLKPSWAAGTVRAAMAIAVIGGILGVRAHLDPWVRAAMLRDRIVAAADRAGLRECADPRVENLPDNLDGAYVFRNGFPQALQLGRQPGVTPTPKPQSCQVRWDGEEMVP